MKLTEQHVEQVCRPGEGAATCRYLAVDARGFVCAKLMPDLASVINQRVAEHSMNAQGDNCEGRDN